MKINFDSHLLPHTSFHINNLKQHKLKVINSRFENCEINSKAFHKKEGNFSRFFFLLFFYSFHFLLFLYFSKHFRHFLSYSNVHIYTLISAFVAFITFAMASVESQGHKVWFSSIKGYVETKGSVMKSFTCRDVTGDWNSTTSFYS